MSKLYWRYGLWSLTLLTVWWVCAIVSAVVGGKGMDRREVNDAREG